MFKQNIEKLKEALDKHGSKFITPRLGAVNGSVYKFVCGQEHLFFCAKPSLIMENFDFRPHCEIEMTEEDWDSVINGNSSIMGKVIAGKSKFLKHERRYIMHLSMLTQAVLLENQQ